MYFNSEKVNKATSLINELVKVFNHEKLIVAINKTLNGELEENLDKFRILQPSDIPTILKLVKSVYGHNGKVFFNQDEIDIAIMGIFQQPDLINQLISDELKSFITNEDIYTDKNRETFDVSIDNLKHSDIIFGSLKDNIYNYPKMVSNTSSIPRRLPIGLMALIVDRYMIKTDPLKYVWVNDIEYEIKDVLASPISVHWEYIVDIPEPLVSSLNASLNLKSIAWS